MRLDHPNGAVNLLDQVVRALEVSAADLLRAVYTIANTE
jgi:hypothetical protein